MSAAQFAAGQRFDRLTRCYLQAIAAPRPDPRSNALDYGPRSADIDPDSPPAAEQMADHRAIVAAMGEARAVLAGCGKAAEAAVRGLCEARELPVGWSGQSALAAGLSALAEHWHLGRNARNRGKATIIGRNDRRTRVQAMLKKPYYFIVETDKPERSRNSA